MTDEGRTSDRSQPTSDEILTALWDAGWLLEQETASALNAAGFNTLMGTAFRDLDDPSTSREIDVTGWQQWYHNANLRMSVGCRVIAECKQSTMPYVLIGRPITDHARAATRLEQKFRFPSVETNKTQGPNGYQSHAVGARQYLRLDGLEGNPWPDGFVATQMTRLDRKRTWLADNRGIFSSLVHPLAKALIHMRGLYKGNEHADHNSQSEWAYTVFFYPLVVTSAPVYVVDVSQPSLIAESKPWATMTRNIESAKVTGQFYVDVVTHERLGDFLEKRINVFGRQVAALAEADPRRFITRIDHDFNPKSLD